MKLIELILLYCEFVTTVDRTVIYLVCREGRLPGCGAPEPGWGHGAAAAARRPADRPVAGAVHTHQAAARPDSPLSGLQPRPAPAVHTGLPRPRHLL